MARRPLEQTMARYLIDRIENAPSVVVWTGCEIQALHGDDKLEAVTIHGSDRDCRLDATAVFAMIGAVPRTDGVVGFVGLDDREFIVTGEDLGATRISLSTGGGRTGRL